MNKEREAFYRGILAALQHVAAADLHVLFDEIVESADADELIAVATRDGQMQMSGLAKYGYGKRARQLRKGSRLTPLASAPIKECASPVALFVGPTVCLAEGCEKRAYALNLYCPKHRRRFQRHGDPSIVLKRGRKAK